VTLGSKKCKSGYGGVWESPHVVGVWSQVVSFVLVRLAGIHRKFHQSLILTPPSTLILYPHLIPMWLLLKRFSTKALLAFHVSCIQATWPAHYNFLHFTTNLQCSAFKIYLQRGSTVHIRMCYYIQKNLEHELLKNINKNKKLWKELIHLLSLYYTTVSQTVYKAIILHKITEFYTMWFSICPKIISKFQIIAIFKS
jgi:hypothetical protein